MVMNRVAKNPRVPIIEIILVLIALGLIGFIVWYVAQARSNTDKVLSGADKSSSQTATRTSGYLSVANNKLPRGWDIDKASNEIVLLKSDSTGCYAQLTYTIDLPANNLEVDRQKEVTQNIAAKGFTVRNIGSFNQTLQTSTGPSQITGRLYRVALNGKTAFQSYGFVSTSRQYITTQLSCPLQSDLTAASLALQAITINRTL